MAAARAPATAHHALRRRVRSGKRSASGRARRLVRAELSTARPSIVEAMSRGTAAPCPVEAGLIDPELLGETRVTDRTGTVENWLREGLENGYALVD